MPCRTNAFDACGPLVRALWTICFEQAFNAQAIAIPDFVDLFDHLSSPAERTALEKRLAGLLPGINADDVVVGILPRQMQGKPADTLVAWCDGQAMPMDRLAAAIGFPPLASVLPEQYQRLRRLTIYLPAHHPAFQDFEAVCRRELTSVRPRL
jgi:hypothetical protein